MPSLSASRTVASLGLPFALAGVMAALAVACTGEVRTEVPSQPSANEPDASAAPDAVVAGPDAWRSIEPDASTGSSADAGLSSSPDAWTAPRVAGCDEPVEQEVVALANEARAAVGLGPLRCDPAMSAVARAHSTDMCTRRYFSHTSLDGRSPFDRMRDGGVRFRTAGENIAWGQRTAREVHGSWMGSSGHRRNILGSAYGRIGVGLDQCGGRMYWTQIFAD